MQRDEKFQQEEGGSKRQDYHKKDKILEYNFTLPSYTSNQGWYELRNGKDPKKFKFKPWAPSNLEHKSRALLTNEYQELHKMRGGKSNKQAKTI